MEEIRNAANPQQDTDGTLMESQRKIYEHLTLEEAESYISSNLVTAARAYVANGYFLKRIRDDRLYQDDGYQNFEDYVRDRYGKDKGWASKCIKVNNMLSVDGDSPYLDRRYQDYTTYQLVELAYMDEEQREQATPEQTVKQLQEMRRPREIPYFEMEGQLDFETDFPEIMPGDEVAMSQLPEEPAVPASSPTFTMDVAELVGEDDAEVQETVATSQQELLSAYGTKKRVYPEGSLIASEGCEGGMYNCFSCAMDCQIRGEDRNCRYAMLGNPFPCTTMHVLENIRNEIGDECQFINHELAQITVGSHEPSPCCMRCKNPCGYACARAAHRTAAEVIPEESAVQKEAAKELTIDDIDLSVSTYNCLKRAGIEKLGELRDMSDDELVRIRNLGARGLQEVKRKVRELYEQDDMAPDVIDAEFTEIPEEPVKTFDRKILQEMIDDTREMMDALQEGWKKSQPRTYTKYAMMMQAYQNLLEAGEKPAEEDSELVEQPDLPVLRNNDQRKEWLRNYRDWGLWYEDEHTGARYYKYDFDNGARLIAEEYENELTHSIAYTSSYMHLVGGPEPPKHTQYGVAKWNRNEKYNRFPNSDTELLEFLKELQKKG